MSNQIQLVRTNFIDIKSGDENYGYRLFDNYGASYGMFADNHKPPEDDREFLLDVANGCSDDVQELLDAAFEHGLEIDGVRYDGKTIESWLVA